MDSELASLVVNFLDEFWVFEAVLLGNLQEHELVRPEIKKRLGTTFLKLLQRTFKYPRWTPRPWFVDAIAYYIRILKARPYLKPHMHEFCSLVLKSNLDRFPEINSVMPDDLVRFNMKDREWLTSNDPPYFGPL
ncbi:MAG: hypothetical protein ACFFCP_04760 [Promethearchaeota archaeon]